MFCGVFILLLVNLQYQVLSLSTPEISNHDEPVSSLGLKHTRNYVGLTVPNQVNTIATAHKDEEKNTVNHRLKILRSIDPRMYSARERGGRGANCGRCVCPPAKTSSHKKNHRQNNQHGNQDNDHSGENDNSSGENHDSDEHNKKRH